MRFDDLAVCAEKLTGCILIALNRSFKAVVLIFAILAPPLAYRAFRRDVLSRTNRGVLEESRSTALT
jgi:hypothetical protein